jgi:2-polyprenyl-6-hydroxyphenyl methylase/3-demethylubiquinone-9 3-methyltransferase
MSSVLPYNFVMSINNDLYNQNAHTWWDKNSFLYILRVSVNPVRVTYFEEVLSKLKVKPTGLTVLDVGCGGGYLAEELSRLGCLVTGIDPSAASVATATNHANQTGLGLTYRVARAESLPFGEVTFDVVTCCDVLEHVSDLDGTISEISRVLKPGGFFFYDTINRSFMSWLGVIFTAQEFPLTRFFPTRTHNWTMFIKPKELINLLRKYHIENKNIKGMTAAVSPMWNVLLMLQMKLGRLSYREYAIKTKLHLSDDIKMNYIGIGIKNKLR